MDPFATRSLGRTGVQLTRLGFGGAHLGELYHTVREEQAQDTIAAAYGAGVRYFDTAPWYGHGLSEHRLGHFLRRVARNDFVLSTKVGRVYRAPADPASVDTGPWAGGLPFELRFDYTYDGIMRSHDDSLQRLGLNRVDLLFIHDLDFVYHGTEEGVEAHLRQLDAGGWKALDELRSEGRVKGVGAGINQTAMMPRFLDRFDIDAFLVAMPYTLLDQDALEDVFPRCADRGVGIVIGSPYASGILATGAVVDAKYNYAPASSEIAAKVRRIEAVCGRHGVPLAAAALQFPLGHPSVAAVIPGAVSAAQVETNVRTMGVAVPAALWDALKSEGLLNAAAPTP